MLELAITLEMEVAILDAINLKISRLFNPYPFLVESFIYSWPPEKNHFKSQFDIKGRFILFLGSSVHQ